MKRSAYKRKVKLDSAVKVRCWCESEIVDVAVRDVRRGLTAPCGARPCRRMDYLARRGDE